MCKKKKKQHETVIEAREKERARDGDVVREN